MAQLKVTNVKLLGTRDGFEVCKMYIRGPNYTWVVTQKIRRYLERTLVSIKVESRRDGMLRHSRYFKNFKVAALFIRNREELVSIEVFKR